jgi:hypothetical protein
VRASLGVRTGILFFRLCVTLEQHFLDVNIFSRDFEFRFLSRRSARMQAKITPSPITCS